VDHGLPRREHLGLELAGFGVETQEAELLARGVRVDHEELVAAARDVVVAFAGSRVLPGLAEGRRRDREHAPRRDAEAQVAEDERLVERVDRLGAEELPRLQRHPRDEVALRRGTEHDRVVLAADPRAEPAPVADLAG
jgi:hypothetical protein